MIPLPLSTIAEITGGTLHGPPDAVVGGPVVIDSRAVVPGALFAAFEGERADGHAFAPAALAAGAAAVLARRPVEGPAVVVDDVQEALGRLARGVLERLPGVTVIAVTGSAGKTSTKDLIAQVVSRAGPTVWPPGSFNNEIGLPLTVLRADARTRYLVLEMGARGIGHIAYLTGIARPGVGVVLNVGTAHVGEFGGRENIAVAKGEIIEAVPEGGTAVLNADDPLVAAMAPRTRAKVVTFGRSPAATVRAAGETLDERGRARFTLVTPEGAAPVALRLYGAHAVANALAAAAAARAAGLPPDEVAEALSRAEPASRWRMEVADSGDGVTVVNDAYNANPDSTRAAIDTTRHLARDRRAFAVLGEMAELGAASVAEHAKIGQHVARSGFAGLVVVGPNAAAMAEGAGQVASWTGECVQVDDVGAAVTALSERLRPRDVVLVKGSRVAGMERVAEAILAGRAGEAAR
ncbi:MULTISPECIES: UDP-N-acetylmuramoyl-tripeptide--D-alanyl-D-alanine ligase [Actinomadura]|uniref:UDP-N-acetylmuramoyl-tripeptide--D-alanyl-D-alanine ligase n=1 Tax=Actinomadura litoris TaxID=2678616 RepID=A0A7K1LBC3_9ACTN|nr:MULTISPECIES: UDP-N-acetylmuramoyl-tripeptide--D-alanyl-D-alanine ligase [Actinomadura]MBT2209820.1 UDP-N-acetylmuramoyl-tripeptide--D-alanyl-D-alanine ligase [Actinomadura sp. NEAU-AAG7]MUN41724.1 UDP-N-acetylmuramoyl-tripeptide--D-alanyl-D-alanine ligase [Actinomadura litoris]